MNEKYKQYKRIFPKLKLSYTLYKLWLRKDYSAIWNYLTGLGEAYTSTAMDNGKDVHKYLEEHSILPAVRELIGKTKKYKKEWKIEKEMDLYKLVGILDLSTPKIIIDYKSGKSQSGYDRQLSFYAYLTFLATGKIPEHGAIVYVEGYKDDNLDIVEVEVIKTSMYEINEKKVFEWEEVLYEIYNEINYEIKKGSLDKFLKLNQ